METSLGEEEYVEGEDVEEEEEAEEEEEEKVETSLGEAPPEPRN